MPADPDRVAAEYFKLLGIVRIADAEFEGGPRLPLPVLAEARDWPWEPPVMIETGGGILRAIAAAGYNCIPLLPLTIDGRLYVLQEFEGGPAILGRENYEVARWELATAAMAGSRGSTIDAWDAWHFPRPHELARSEGVWRAAAWKLERSYPHLFRERER